MSWQSFCQSTIHQSFFYPNSVQRPEPQGTAFRQRAPPKPLTTGEGSCNGDPVLTTTPNPTVLPYPRSAVPTCWLARRSSVISSFTRVLRPHRSEDHGTLCSPFRYPVSYAERFLYRIDTKEFWWLRDTAPKVQVKLHVSNSHPIYVCAQRGCGTIR